MVTFGVDDVVPAAERLATRPRAERERGVLVGGDPATPLIDHGGVQPLLAAVGIAFAQHRPLALSPDAVWLTIAQGVAQHIRLHAEALRPRLVRHDGRKPLTVAVERMPTERAAWEDVIAELRGALGREIGDGPARLFECDFSTSTLTEKVASQVVLLEAYSPYFSYWLMCVCGIPQITLTGTVADWERIRARVDVIAELGLATWCRSLAPILDHFVLAAMGEVDQAFWQRIYNPADAYGGALITGWATRFYPYLQQNGGLAYPNPMLKLSIDEPRNRPSNRGRDYNGPGIGSDLVPDVRARVRVHIVDGNGSPTMMALEAGLVGVAQLADGALCPVAGWSLQHATIEMPEVAARIVAEHAAEPVRTDARTDTGRLPNGPAEIMALYQQLASATLFSGARTWRIRPQRAHDELELGGNRYVRRVIDLDDGRAIGYEQRGDAVRWLLCRVDGKRARQPVIRLGDSLSLVLHAALDADGHIDERGQIAPAAR